jgi:hypothetical protein
MATKNIYTEQAEEFLNKTQTKMSISFSHKGKHFQDDKEERNVYVIKLQNDKHTFVFNYGDSINNTKRLENAQNLKEKTEYKPTKYDVLACLNVDYSEDFEDFCSNFGYEENDFDNKKNNFINESAFVIYKAVQKETENLKLLFSEEEIELLHEVQ